jgi:hypothetical protein
MKPFLKYFWILALILILFQGVNTIQNEWKRKSIHDHGKLVDVKIDKLNCPNGVMTFHFGSSHFEKNIDARTCVLFNEGQTIKLRHNPRYADTFLFANERSPNRFILGGLEITLGFIGLIANWPFINSRRKMKKKIQISY